MKNSIYEKMIWYALSPTIFRFIEQYWKDIDIKSIKRLSKDNYKAMISRTPDIGSFRKNPLKIPLAGGMLWLSVYDAGKQENLDLRLFYSNMDKIFNR